MAAGVKEVESVEDFNKILADAANNLVVAHFAAPWAPQCKQMTEVMSVLAQDSQLKQVTFIQIEAEKLAEISEKNNIIAVPTFIFFKGGKSVDRLDGANAADLTKKVQGLAGGSIVASPPPPAQKQDLNTRLKQLINCAPVMLFMKGTPDQPRCGFSRQMISILNEKNIKYSTFDILSDEEVRQGLKTYSNWPTYPQLYAGGELLGGLDIVKELVETGELESQLPAQISLEDRLPVINSNLQSMLYLIPPSYMIAQNQILPENCCGFHEPTQIQLTAEPVQSGMNMTFNGFTVTTNISEDDEQDQEDLPLWFGGQPLSNMGPQNGGSGSKEEKREKERVRQMLTRRRDQMILNLPVHPNMIIPEANKVWVEQQRNAGVAEEDITSLQTGRDNYSTIGELKRKIEQKRAIDRERKRTKRAELGEGVYEEVKRECRERMRAKRARLKEQDPAAAAAYRERERIRKRIERRRNAMVLSLPNESITPNTQGLGDNGNPAQMPLTPEFSSALLVLRENLLQKRFEQKEKVRQRRAELREKHPEIAAAIRERERLRKRIERRRNSLLLNMGPDALLQATQAIMNQDSSSSEASQSSAGLPLQTEPLEDSTKFTALSAPTPDCSDAINESFGESESSFEGSIELSTNLEKLIQSAQRKKDHNKERMRQKRAELREDPEAFEAMKERERLRKQVERMKKKGTGSEDEDRPLTFAYDVPQGCSTSTATFDAQEEDEDEDLIEDNEKQDQSASGIKQEPLENHGKTSGETSTVAHQEAYQPMNTEINETSSEQKTEMNPPVQNANLGNLSNNLIKLEPDFNSSNENEESFTSLQSYQHCNQEGSSTQVDPDVIRVEEKLALQSVEARLKASIKNSGSMNIPAFSSVDEERDWFQTQLCHIQTRVLDPDKQGTPGQESAGPSAGVNLEIQGTIINSITTNPSTNDQGESASQAGANPGNTPADPTSLTPIYHNTGGQFSLNPFTDMAKLTANPTPNSDYLSGIAEVTLRSSLEQITALAGPEVMQDRLCQMVQSAKQAREKANEQARRRREKLRKDPAMRHKYEEIKARDMERKRQQRAKEAEIRTVFPAYNEEKRIRDRERKKMLRSRNKELGEVLENTSNIPVNTDSNTIAQSISQSINNMNIIASGANIPLANNMVLKNNIQMTNNIVLKNNTQMTAMNLNNNIPISNAIGLNSNFPMQTMPQFLGHNVMMPNFAGFPSLPLLPPMDGPGQTLLPQVYAAPGVVPGGLQLSYIPQLVQEARPDLQEQQDVKTNPPHNPRLAS